MYVYVLPWYLSWERIHLQSRRPRFDSWVGKIPWRRERLHTPIFWPGELHGLYIVHWVSKSQTGLSDFDFTHFTSLWLHSSSPLLYLLLLLSNNWVYFSHFDNLKFQLYINFSHTIYSFVSRLFFRKGCQDSLLPVRWPCLVWLAYDS